MKTRAHLLTTVLAASVLLAVTPGLALAGSETVTTLDRQLQTLKVQVQQLQAATPQADKATPKLQQASVGGANLPAPSSKTLAGSQPGTTADDVPTETLSLNYDKISYSTKAGGAQQIDLSTMRAPDSSAQSEMENSRQIKNSMHDGKSSGKSKGNVETTWKVEKGEKAPPADNQDLAAPGDDPQTTGLLLPAIQKARDPSPRGESGDPDQPVIVGRVYNAESSTSPGNVKSGQPDGQEAPLLPPAIQAPRGSTRSSKDGSKGGNVEFEWKVEEGESAPPAEPDRLKAADNDPQAAGLLLPAVQKVRDSASRSEVQNNLKQIGTAQVGDPDEHGRVKTQLHWDRENAAQGRQTPKTDLGSAMKQATGKSSSDTAKAIISNMKASVSSMADEVAKFEPANTRQASRKVFLKAEIQNLQTGLARYEGASDATTAQAALGDIDQSITSFEKRLHELQN